MTKKQTAFRLSDNSSRMLNDLKEWNDSDRTAEVEKAIGLYYRLELMVRERVRVDQ